MPRQRKRAGSEFGPPERHVDQGTLTCDGCNGTGKRDRPVLEVDEDNGGFDGDEDIECARLRRHGETEGEMTTPPEPVAVPFVHLRCPAHRGRRRRQGYKGLRPGVACPDCRTVWAAGRGPEAAREQEESGEAAPTERGETLPPV